MEEFLALHEPQLKSINFPSMLYDGLYERLHNGSSGDDATLETSFEIKRFENSRSMLISKKDLNISESFYLIDHVWKNDGGKSTFEKLEKSPDLTEKLSTLFNIPRPVEAVSSFDFTKEIDVMASMTDTTKDDVEKELKECDCDTIATIMKLLDRDKETEVDRDTIKKKKTKKKCTFDEFKSALQFSGHTSGNENEAYMQKMYENFLLEADGCGNTLHYNWSDDGSVLTIFVSIPPTTRKQAVTSTLNINSWKLVVNGVQILKGDLYAAVKPDESFWAIESPGVLCMTLEKVICENVWPELIKGEVRLSQDTIFSTSFLKAGSSFLYLKEILDRMWCYNQMFAIMSSDGAKKPVWYIMDEYGSSLTHAKDANFQCSPFFNIRTGETYNLLWPIKNINKGSVCTRNFIPQIMPGETVEMSRARLKAFTGSKIYKSVELQNADDDGQEETNEKVEVVHLSNQDDSGANKVHAQKSVWLSIYGSNVPKDVCSKLNWNVALNMEEGVDLNLLTFKETSIMIDGDVLPTHEMLANKSFLQSYINFQSVDFSWFQKSYILPLDLEEFSREVESCDVPWLWVVRQVDKRQVDVDIVVSSSYSRIVRMCEAGSIAVSKFIVDQPQFRHRRFVLNYSVILSKLDSSIFIYKEPLIHQTKDDYDPNALVCEYDTSNDIITGRHELLVAQQDSETYKDLQSAMNKLLLPKDADRGWSVYQDTIFQRIGTLAKTFLKDIVIERTGPCFVLFGVDILIDSNLSPIVLDINGQSNLPTNHSLEQILELVNGNICDNFVKVI